MKFIGLLMVSGEDDILEPILRCHERIVDEFYVLDGTRPNTYSRGVCERSEKCAGYFTDDDLPAIYGAKPRDGWRQFIYAQAVADHGPDNWFLLLHGDELWTFNPAVVTARWPNADGFGFRLPFYFPHMRDGWNADIAPLDQLRWRLGPGWPEFRMFRGNPNVLFHPLQHFNVRPQGLSDVVQTDHEIRHFPFRAPEVQRARAARHLVTGFDPDNYAHINYGDNVLWDERLIDHYRRSEHFRELAHA